MPEKHQKEKGLFNTPENIDVFTLNSENLDLHRIRNFVRELPPINISIASLETQVREQLWDDESEKEDSCSPASLIDEYKRLSNNLSAVLVEHPSWADRIKRIQEADYSHPILIYKGVIIDGLHRILHAFIDKQETISAHVFKKLPSDLYSTHTFSQ